MTQDAARLAAKRRKKAKLLVMLFVTASIAFLAGTGYVAHLSYKEKEQHETLARRILQARSHKIQLQRQLEEWRKKLANTPEDHFLPIKQAGPLGVAFIRDAAEEHSINITDVRYTTSGAGGVNRQSSAEDIDKIAAYYNKEQNAPIRAIRIQYRASWQSLDDLDGWLDALLSHGIIVENLKLKANYAEIECSIIGT